MIADIETSSFVMLPLEKIVSRLSVRRLSASGIARLQESMKWAGFLENYPLTVTLCEGGYLLIDGNHRYEAAKGLGTISLIPCVIKSSLTESELYQMAMQSNNAAETVIPSTLVTYAEFIWARLAEVDEDGKKKYTQSDVGKMLGWGRDRVTSYAALRKICPKAWDTIVSTFGKSMQTSENEVDTINVSTVAFTERLLRDILDLTPDQQTELVQSLSQSDKDKRITKGKFAELAKAYQARNGMKKYALDKLGELEEGLSKKLAEGIDSGAYDVEWQKSKDEKDRGYGEHPKLDRLIESIKAEWEKKHSIYLVQGDFYERVKEVREGSIDLILTDPPYNLANERKFTFEGRASISQDFGEWDKYNRQNFIELFDTWAYEWDRILRDGGSGYVFTSDVYLSYLIVALERVGLEVKITIVWHKTNPAPQVKKVTFQSAVEYVIFFVKGKNHTFNWQGDEGEMHDFIESSLCMGNERLEDSKKNTLHPTQKPLKVLKHLIEVSSNRGDMVFDGFAGVGSSGAAAKELGRKFKGIELDTVFFEAMQRRLTDE